MNAKLNSLLTFVAAVGGGAVITVAGATVVSLSAATPIASPVATEVVRLDPVTVTVSKARFDEIRTEETAIARANAPHREVRG